MNASSLPHAQLGELSDKHQQTTHPCFGVRCIAGSGSLNDRLATLVASIAGQRVTVDRGRMEDFDSPSYDIDVKGLPAGAEQLRGRIEAAHAFVIVSPEYNASMPGTVKNVIDWVSRARPSRSTANRGCCSRPPHHKRAATAASGRFECPSSTSGPGSTRTCSRWLRRIRPSTRADGSPTPRSRDGWKRRSPARPGGSRGVLSADQEAG